MLKFVSISTLLLCFCVLGFAQTAPLPDYLKPIHKIIIQQWLKNNPKYLFATDEDCGCDYDINYFRNGSRGDKAYTISPDYHPYYVVGDFNGDGQEDFAIAVKSSNKKNINMVILVFNGPVKKLESVKPNFMLKNNLQLGQGLFYFLNSKPRRLLFGVFESESCLLEPVEKTYKVDCGEEY